MTDAMSDALSLDAMKSISVYSASDCRSFFESSLHSVSNITTHCYQKAKSGERSTEMKCDRYMFNIDNFDQVMDEISALGFRVNCKATRAFLLSLDPGDYSKCHMSHPPFKIEW